MIAVGGTDGRVYLVDEMNTSVIGRYPIRLPLNPGAVESVAFNSKSRYLLTSNSCGNLTMWDLKRKLICREFKGHAPGRVKKAIFNQNDEHVISGGATGKILLHNIRSGGVSLELQHPNHSAVEYCCIPGMDSGFPHMLSSSHSNGSICLWDINAGVNKAVVTWQNHSCQPAVAIDILHNQSVLMSVGGKGKIEMFDLRDGVSLTSGQGFACGSVPLTSISCHPNEQLVLVGSSDGQVHLLDLRGNGETKVPVMVTKRIKGNHESITGITWQRSKPQDAVPKENVRQVYHHSPRLTTTSPGSTSSSHSIEYEGEANPRHDSSGCTSTLPTPSLLNNNTHSSSSLVVGGAEESLAHVDIQVIRQIMRDIVEESRGQLHKDIQNLHLDMLTQFQQQADDFQELLKPHTEVLLRLIQENK